jgi:IS30 family transposase
MYHQLSHEERYRISAEVRAGQSLRAVARLLGRSPSTVSRELRRNATNNDGLYRPDKAQRYCVARRRRCRRGPRFGRGQLAMVERLIRRRWSPRQVCGTLRAAGTPVPSHETIYRHIRRDKRDGGVLFRFTRIMSKKGRKHYRSPVTRGVMPGKRHISERPAHVEARREIGHWEGDTVMGRDLRHCLLTLVERKSGFAIIKKLKARTKAEVTRAATRAIAKHVRRFKTITFDNGTEFHDFAVLERRFPIACYFATPYHSWERGSNENLNGLIRQYLPKGKCLSRTTQAHCDHIANELNTRPRERHGFQTPSAIYISK